jgi:hypothetical protein
MFDLTSQRVLAGAAGAGEKLYVEDVFSTWLYTGNGSTQTITNGIDLSGKGGLVWLKDRVYTGGGSHNLYDTTRGVRKFLNTESTSSESSISAGNGLTSFNVDGFTLGTNWNNENRNGDASVSWTFRKAAKFFDVVTYTGTGTTQAIPHNLGSVPGMYVCKSTSGTGNWNMYHRGLSGANKYLVLNSTAAEATSGSYWDSQAPTADVFYVGNNNAPNANGVTYVAYLFAHDAGGFGDSGNDSVISCGSFTTNGIGSATVQLGWEPQWVMLKCASTNDGFAWPILDTMRGWNLGGGDQFLFAGSSAAETNVSVENPTSTGFSVSSLQSSATYIYIAIRRGPMKTPTDATKVFATEAVTPSSGGLFNTSFAVDLSMGKWRTTTSNTYTSVTVYDRLRGYQITQGAGSNNRFLITSSADAEASNPSINTLHYGADRNNGILYGSGASGLANITYAFRRAPGYMDVVAYTGTGSARTVSHNLGVAPELMIVKVRDTGYKWMVYSSSIGNTQFVSLNETTAATTSSITWNNTTPTSSVFTLGTSAFVNGSGNTYIAYLFATCPGVSKVGSYTGTGTTLDIDCGFTSGSRLVLIKRTDSTGNWYIWDSARGIVSGNDTYLLLNSTAAEVTNTDYIDPLSSGFQISSTAPAEINASGGSYIFLAVA